MLRTERSAGVTSRTLVCAVTAAALLAAPLVATAPASASPDGTGLVIEEAYLKGGSANQPFTNKFVELGNPTDAPISVDGWSLQYRAATSTGAPSIGKLAGSVPAHGTYLVQMGSNGSNGQALPEADAVTGLNPSGSTGTLVLADQATALTLPCRRRHDRDAGRRRPARLRHLEHLRDRGRHDRHRQLGARRADPHGYDRHGLERGGLLADEHGHSRERCGRDDPADRPDGPDRPGHSWNTGRAGHHRTAAGNDGHLAVRGKTVRTDGVVTAVYATGGFNGYTVQTAGTGGALDLGTHTASDAVFVYSAATAAKVAIGDVVRLTGTVSEFNGLTELTVSSTAGLEQLPKDGVAKPVPATLTLPRTDAQRESLESMLVAPQGDYTVADNYTTNQYGEVVLASGKQRLLQPTEVARPGSTEAAAVAADNAARQVTLDDGASTNFLSAANQSVPVSWLTQGPVTVGAAATFDEPVVMDYRNDSWKFQPTSPITGATPAADLPVSFSDVRTAAPENVGGDVKLAGFNVLNYFPTTGDQLTGCTYYTDRDGDPVTVRGGCDARGAANADDLARQQVKIVKAINGLGADVVSLEEIENSARFGRDRDAAVGTLVAALNAATGKDTWAYAKSPSKLPASEDVIRLALIYKKDRVQPVGGSTILTDSDAFANARQPLAQAFAPVVTKPGKGKGVEKPKKADTFLVIANHFKSKGSGTGADADQGDGQGASNASRVAQSKALVAFSTAMQKTSGTDKVFMLGDFNAYSQEDPVRVLDDAGYTDLGPTEDPTEWSYVFSGLSGSLDHVFASPAAMKTVTGVDIWNINSVESVGLEYSRYDYNVTDLYRDDVYRASDHDPILVGIDLPGVGQPGKPVTARQAR